MENEHVLSGLVRKRSEIAGQIEHTQFALRQLVADLDSIDAAIKKPVTTRDIALVVMKARGLNPEDQALLVTIPQTRWRVHVEAETATCGAGNCRRR